MPKLADAYSMSKPDDVDTIPCADKLDDGAIPAGGANPNSNC